MESLLFVALAPLASVLMLGVGFVAWQRREVPGGWGLTAFSVTGAGWLAFDALSVAAQTPEATLVLARVAVAWAPFPGVAWLAFLLSFTGRLTRPARVALGVLGAWSLVYGAMALTNDAHGLVWATSATVADGPFVGAAYTLGPVGWVQTAFMWAVVSVSLGYVLWTYARAGGRRRALSRWIVVGALVPLAVNVVHLLGFAPVEKDFTPLAMAVSSATFALGLVRYQLLDLRPIARTALVDSLAEGMLVLDARGFVVDTNPALRETLGEDLALGRPLRETAPALADAIDSAPGETLPIGEGPGVRYVDLRVSRLADGAGATTGRLVLLHDVTQRREERAALRRANADLQVRNEELDAFAHTVAHDLKNSIQGVIGYAEALRDDNLSDDLAREFADALVQTGRKMGTVVHELLLLAGVRRATVASVPLDMMGVVDEALDRTRPLLERAGASVVAPEAWPTAMGYGPWVEEVWVNYLSNAAKYGGRPARVTLGAECRGGAVRFWVEDAGPGIAGEAQDRLFIPFSRLTPGPAEGHGLGLSIVRRIVEKLGGACGVESEGKPGRGSRFWFELPAAVALPGDVPGGSKVLGSGSTRPAPSLSVA